MRAALVFGGVVLSVSACAASHRANHKGGDGAPAGQARTAPTSGSYSRRPGIVRRIKVGAMPYDAVAAFGSIWIATTDGVARFDPATGRLESKTTIRQRGEWMNVAAGGGAIWYASGASLIAIDPSNGRIARLMRVGPASGREAYEFVGASSKGACVSQITPSDRVGLLCVPRGGRRVRRLSVGPGPIVGAPDGSLWVGGPSLARLTLTPRKMTSIRVSPNASVAAVAARGDSVWAALNSVSSTSARSQLWQVRHGRVAHRFDLPGVSVVALAPTHRRVWFLAQLPHAHTRQVGFIKPSGDWVIVSRVPLESRALVAATDSSVWTVQYREGTATIVTAHR